jgi:hypothetical protein
MLHSSSVAFLKISASVWKGCFSGMSQVLLLGASAPSPLGSWSCLLRLLARRGAGSACDARVARPSVSLGFEAWALLPQ